MKREYRNPEEQGETFCLAVLAGLLSKRFQSLKPITTLRQFIYTPDTVHLSTGSW